MIIGFCGPKGSGKTTCSLIMSTSVLDEGIVAIGGSFAKKLKDSILSVTKLPRQYFYSQEYKNIDCINVKVGEPFLTDVANFFGVKLDKDYSFLYGTYTSPRVLMQTIGTDFLRSIDKHIHVKATMDEASKHGFYIIDDVRTENELEAIRDAGGVVIYVDRDEANAVALKSDHPSENLVPLLKDKCDYVVKNDKMGDLVASIDNIILEKITLNSLRYM